MDDEVIKLRMLFLGVRGVLYVVKHKNRRNRITFS
jgi:hypothetical protein